MDQLKMENMMIEPKDIIKGIFKQGGISVANYYIQKYLPDIGVIIDDELKVDVDLDHVNSKVMVKITEYLSEKNVPEPILKMVENHFSRYIKNIIITKVMNKDVK